MTFLDLFKMAAKLTAEFLKDWKNDVNPDLKKERDTATFKTEELTHVIDGGEAKTKRRKELGCLYIYIILYNGYAFWGQ